MQCDKSPEQLCAENLRLATWAANKFLSCGLEFDDLQGAANLGLVKAANKFDPARGCRFASFAYACIRNEIFMLLRHERPHMNLRHLEESLCCDCDGDDIFLRDTLPNPAPPLAENLEQAEAASRLQHHVEALPKAQREVVQLSYGLGGNEPLLQIEVAKQLGMSRAWVSRKHKAALENLKEDFRDANN